MFESCDVHRRSHGQEIEMEEWLRIGAYVGSMLTSMIAAGASAGYWADKRSKRRRLEDHLKARKERSPHEAFSATRLMADLGMTEAEIFAASFTSRHIVRVFAGTRPRGLQLRC